MKIRTIVIAFLLSTYSSVSSSIEFKILGFNNNRYKNIEESIEKITEKIESDSKEYSKKIAILFHGSEDNEYQEINDYDIIIYFYINNFEYIKINETNITAIFSGQPIQRQISLALSINNETGRLSIPWSKVSQLNKIEEQYKKFPHIRWNIPMIRGESRDQTNISKSLHNADALIAIDDTDIYNANSLRSILLSAYRLRKPMIGPGPAFVKAGAMASVYSDLDDYLNELESLIREFLESGEVPEPRWPNNFDIIISDNVARSLGYLGLDRDVLLKKIRMTEQTGDEQNP